MHKYTSISFLSVRGFSSPFFNNENEQKKFLANFVCYLFPIPFFCCWTAKKNLSKKQNKNDGTKWRKCKFVLQEFFQLKCHYKEPKEEVLISLIFIFFWGRWNEKVLRRGIKLSLSLILMWYNIKKMIIWMIFVGFNSVKFLQLSLGCPSAHFSAGQSRVPPGTPNVPLLRNFHDLFLGRPNLSKTSKFGNLFQNFSNFFRNFFLF